MILLVENDQNLRQSIALILKHEGYLVTDTSCINSALKMLQESNLRLVITDYDMPDAKHDLLPKILEVYPYVSIVVMTGLPASEIKKEERLLSAHYLTKPIAPERLLDCVGSILAERGHSNNP